MSQQSIDFRRQRREFGAYLKDLRKRRHLTLEKVASALGVSAGEISLIEKGSRRGSDQLLIRLAERYGEPLGEMLMKKYWPQLPFLTGIVEPTKLVTDLHKYLYPEEVEEVTRYIAFLLLRRATANRS